LISRLGLCSGVEHITPILGRDGNNQRRVTLQGRVDVPSHLE